MVEPGRGLAGRAVAESAPVTVSHGETTLEIEGLAGTHRVVHEIHVPIRHGEATMGVISLGRLHDEPSSPADLQLISDLAERTGSGCMQALATRRLSRTARDLGAVLETIDEGVYGIDTSGRITLVNRAALELTGYTREELAGANSHELLHHTREDGSPYPQTDCPILGATETGNGMRIIDAARALGRIGGRRNLPTLRQATWDRIPMVREAAADALGQLRDRESVPLLAIRAVGDQFDVARACARAVAAIDPDEAAQRAGATGSAHLWEEAADLAAVL
ncbi:MAG TPA: PAS domain-containing protein [Solirubrobacteraceae bacterium]|nr:PAS domain-containing protein [Solirubrobacteraceae bacterium]